MRSPRKMPAVSAAPPGNTAEMCCSGAYSSPFIDLRLPPSLTCPRTLKPKPVTENRRDLVHTFNSRNIKTPSRKKRNRRLATFRNKSPVRIVVLNGMNWISVPGYAVGRYGRTMPSYSVTEKDEYHLHYGTNISTGKLTCKV